MPPCQRAARPNPDMLARGGELTSAGAFAKPSEGDSVGDAMASVHETASAADHEASPCSGEGSRASLGDTIDGRYTVEAVLGTGGMGMVYRTRERLLERPVAIKMISPAWARQPRFEEAFLEEARAMARLRHPNVVQLYTVGTHGDSYYLAMEFVGGSSLDAILHSHLDRGERLSLHNALALLADVIDGVSAIHDAGLLHCDLKPANVVVEDRTGRPVIIDFGLATHAENADARGGSPAYMCAERTTGEAPISVQSDIYSLGVTAYELLTGCLPYLARTPRDMVEMHRSLPVPSMEELFDELAPFDPILRRAMAKRPEDRFTSCAEMAVALAEAKAQWAHRYEVEPLPPASSADVAAVDVVVVDDDPSFRRAVARATKLAFSDRAVRLMPASSGEQAVAIAQHRTPSLIVLDYQLPGLDGVATLSAIRALPGGYDVRVVVMSGSVDEVRWRFQALGVSDFLAKPASLDDLVGTIQRLLRMNPGPRTTMRVPRR